MEATAAEFQADILLVAEPNKAITSGPNWYTDVRRDAAIRVENKNLVVRRVGAGNGYVWLDTGDVVIYSCYFSPNTEISDFELALNELKESLLSNGKQSIVCGDFNAKAPEWGMSYTDRRGDIVTGWMAELSLVPVNVGTEPTFVRGASNSILDLTLATENVSGHVRYWAVLDRESLSYHRYITFEISSERSVQVPKIRRGWALRKLNVSRFNTELRKQTSITSVNTAEDLVKALTRTCNCSMPKKTCSSRGNSVYWWTEEIAQLRRTSLTARRAYSRHTIGDLEREHLRQNYRAARKHLRQVIKSTKRNCWRQLLLDVDRDIWGKGYHIVTSRLNMDPPNHPLPVERQLEIFEALFPDQDPVVCEKRQSVTVTLFSVSELMAASERLKNNKAPGPDNIPPEVIKLAVKEVPELFLKVMNRALSTSCFPEIWKCANLVLQRKKDKPSDLPSSYRTICLLDAAGKLLEYMVLHRLQEDIESRSGISDRQFGFRKGKSTVDAVSKIVEIARQATVVVNRKMRICALIAVDIKNAFNSASRQKILSELRRLEISDDILQLITSYLQNRKIILDGEGEKVVKSVSGGVPQGSILGPVLWNVLYDGVLRLELPEGVTAVAYADDLAVVVVARDEEELMRKANYAIEEITAWLEDNAMVIAPRKTEAVLLTTRRRLAPISFMVGDTTIWPQRAIKYLGVWLDTKLTFSEHITRAAEKTGRMVGALSRLMPNVGGPKASRRKVLSSVAHSIALYAAPVWEPSLKIRRTRKKLDSVFRRMAIRVCSAYRTISEDAVAVIAGIPPIDLMAAERKETCAGITKTAARASLLRKWQERWDGADKGLWTKRLIPELRDWVERRHGEVDFFLTQVLSGHGCFRTYLHRFQLAEDSNCPYCNVEDDAEHTLFFCQRWACYRELCFRSIHNIITVQNMVTLMLDDENTWTSVAKMVRDIMLRKRQEAQLQEARTPNRFDGGET